MTRRNRLAAALTGLWLLSLFTLAPIAHTDAATAVDIDVDATSSNESVRLQVQLSNPTPDETTVVLSYWTQNRHVERPLVDEPITLSPRGNSTRTIVLEDTNEAIIVVVARTPAGRTTVHVPLSR